MTAQAPLPIAPEEALQISEAAAVVQEGDGAGRVYLRGDLAHMWGPGDEAGRRLAAVQLVQTKAARVYEVAGAFGIGTETLRQWRLAAASQGAVGLVPERRGPKGPSKLTAEVADQIRARRAGGEPAADIAEAVGVSVRSVYTVLAAQAGEGESARSADEEGQADGADAVAGQGAGEQAELFPATGGWSGEDDGEQVGATTAQDGGVEVLARPVPRGGERWAARGHLITAARPVFTAAGQVPLAGMFLALPGVEATGLLAAAARLYRLRPGFYGLATMLLEGVFRALAGEPRAEGATRFDPVALGRVLGMDRAPEVKTIRRKMAYLAAQERGGQLLAAMARAHLDRNTGAGEEDNQASLVLYVDGHVRAYTGKRKIAKTHNPRSRFPAPATVETWVSDADGDPVLVVMAEPGASLAGEIRRLLPDLRAAVGDGRRVLVGFDRGGWSPALFAHMGEQGFDVLTWRKGPVEDVAAEEFSTHTFTDSSGLRREWTLAQTVVRLPIKGSPAFPVRQITRLDEATGRQVHILTTRTDLTPAQVVYRMGSRWRQENHFRYARMHFDLDSHDCYATGDDDPERSVPNPAKEAAKKTVAALTARAEREKTRAQRALLAATTGHSGTEVVLTNQAHNAITADWHAAEDDLAAAQEANTQTPARVALGELAPGQQVLDVESKLLTHAIKIAAFNTVTALARAIRIHTGYARAGDEAHALARQVLRHTGDIIPDAGAGTLTIRLDPMPTARQTRAVAELCAHLNATATTYPGTDLVLRYAVKNQH